MGGKEGTSRLPQILWCAMSSWSCCDTLILQIVDLRLADILHCVLTLASHLELTPYLSLSHQRDIGQKDGQLLVPVLIISTCLYGRY